MIVQWLLGAALAAEVDLVLHDPDGAPVAEAEVRSGDALLGTTSRRGRLRIDLPDGPHEVVVDAPGYRPVLLSVTLPRRRPLRVALSASDADLEVIVEGQRAHPHAARHTVDAEQAMETPGTLDDAVRLVQALPGVTVQREYSPTSGDLSVRGSAPGDSRYFLDGVEIPYLYHFNQYASVFPTSQIGQLELLPSTFGASYGDATGAVVDAKSRLTPPQRTRGSAHLNFVMVGGDVSAPLTGSDESTNQPTGQPVWFSASGRRSYQDLAGEQTTQYPVWPVFHDYVLRLERGDERNGTGAFVMSAGDSYTRAVAELDVVSALEAEQSATLAYREGFEIVGVHHRFHDDRGTHPVWGRVIGAAVSHRRQGRLSDNGREDLGAWTGVVRADLGGRMHPLVAWDAGTELRASHTRLQVVPGGPDAVRVAEEVPALARGTAVDGRLLRRQLGVYGALRIGPDHLQLMPGLRVEGDDAATATVDRWQLGPRLSARYVPVEGTTLRGAVGRYTQRPDSEFLVPGAGSPDLPTTTSWQVAGGASQTVAGRLELTLDAYLKRDVHPLFTPIDAPARAAVAGEARGLELTTRYRLRERLFVWGWLAVAESLVLLDGVVVPADGDQRLSGGLVASYDVGRTNLGARYRYASGLPFTPLEGSLHDAGRDRWIALPGVANGARMPGYHKVDLRLAYTWQLPGWTLTASAEVWLVPRSSAQLYPRWNYDYTEQDWVVGPTVLPLLGVRARF